MLLVSVNTVDMVYTVNMVYAVDMVYTVDMVYIVDMVYTVDTGGADVFAVLLIKWIVCALSCKFSLIISTVSLEKNNYLACFFLQVIELFR